MDDDGFELYLPIWVLVHAATPDDQVRSLMLISDVAGRITFAMFTDDDLAQQCLEINPLDVCSAQVVDDAPTLMAMLILARESGAEIVAIDWTNQPGFRHVVRPIGDVLASVAKAWLVAPWEEQDADEEARGYLGE